MIAAMNGNRKEAFKFIVSHFDVDVNAFDRSGRTALMYSMYAGKGNVALDNARALINHGADVTIVDNYGCNALYFAAQKLPASLSKFEVIKGCLISESISFKK